MIRASTLQAFLLFVGIVLGLAGCAGSTTPSSLLRPSVLTAKDGLLHYRCPIGWFDATADSQSAGHLVWLLRNDYGATIALSRLHMDTGAWDEFHSRGIMYLAGVTMALAAGGKPYAVDRQPASLSMNGWRGCVYELTTSPDEDHLRVALVEGRSSVYMATALSSNDAQRGEREAVRKAQDAFLSSLQW